MASVGTEQPRAGESLEVYVTHVKVNRELGQVNFWAQLDPVGAEQLEELDLVIQEKANSDPHIPEPKSLLVGEPCLANFIEDSRWYRARVEQCTENDVIAYFMDYGNTEIIPFKLIRRADSSVFATLRAQATECILEGVKISPDKPGTLMYLQKLLADQSFTGKPAGFIAGRVHMTLQMETESQEQVANRIIRDGFGQPMKMRTSSNGGHRGSGDNKVQFKNMGLDVGSREKLYISHIESPSSFWIQQSCISLDLDNLMNDLLQFYCEGSGGEAMRRAVEGTPCVALFSEDETFYRAVVDKVLANNQCRVFFVDYGNSEVTSVANLRIITEEFLKLPTIAIKCCLSGIEAASCTSREATARFEDLTGDKELCGKVVELRGDRCAILLVDPNGRENADIAGVLVKEGLAKRDQEQFPMKGSRRVSERAGRASPVSSTSSTGSSPQQSQLHGRLRSEESREPQGPTAFTLPNLRAGSKHQVQVTSVASIFNISCQLLKDADTFDVMMTNLQDAYASPSPDTRLNTPAVNQPYCAQFTEDDSWYRAKVTAIKGSDVDVTYVDYGNREIIPSSRLRVLNDKFFELPLQCISCCLDGISPQEGNTPKARDHFENITSEKTLIASIVSIKHDKNDNYGVVLTEEGTGLNINKEMYKFLQSAKTPPRGQFQSSQPSRTPPRGQQQQHQNQQGFQQRTPPRDQFKQNVKSPPRDNFQQSVKSPPRGQFQQSVKSPPRSESQSGQERSAQGKQAPSPGRSSAPAEMASFTEVQLPVGEVPVYLAHGNSPSEFWCQPVKSGSDLDELMDKVHKKGSSQSVPALKNMAVGTPCIAQFSEDEGWYRAVVVNKHVRELEVLFVDYGNTERVPMAKVKQISPDLMKLPAQAVKCCLKGWDLDVADPKVIDKMKDLANNVEQFKCEHRGSSGSVYEVELSWNGIRMSQELKKIQMQALKEKKQKESTAAPKAPAQQLKTVQQMSTAQVVGHITSSVDNLKVSAHEDFIVSHVDNPARFWCQVAKDCAALDEMMVKINDHYNTSSGDALDSISVGSFCVAKYAEDDGWYRAQILKTISVSQVEVHYIDYGNTDKVDVSNLRKLRPEFCTLKSQAVQCALDGHMGDDYEQDLIAKFQELVLEKQLVGDVKAKRAGMIALELYDTTGDHDININTEVKGMMETQSQPIVSGYPQRSDLQSVGECEVYATHIEGVHKFYVQMSSQTEEIETMSAQLQDAYSSVETSELQLMQSNIGQPCCAKFTEDEQWYRAIITSKPTAERASVCFVDFGNSEEQDVAKLKALKSEFLKQAPLAIECRLGKCRRGVPDSLEKFETLILDKPLTCSFHGNTKAPFGVTLTDGDTNVNEEMSSVVGAAATSIAGDDDDDCSPFTWPTLVSNQESVEVTVTQVTNPFDFWCQLMSDELDALTDSLQEKYGSGGGNTEPLQLTLGSACIGQSNDGHWYRGEVTSVPSGDSAEVLFVDLGIREMVLKTKIRPLDDEFLSLPRQAIWCRLCGVKPYSSNWDGTAVGAFKKLTAVDGLTADIIGIDKGGGTSGRSCFKVLLRSREGMIPDLLTERGHADQDVLEIPQVVPKSSQWTGKTYPREVLAQSHQDVTVVKVESPDKFFVQPLHFLVMEEDLVREIEAFTEGVLGNLVLPDWLPSAEIGMPCLAKSKDDDKWCRAEVLVVYPWSGEVKVVLVDKGIQQKVDKSELRPINAKLVDIPVMLVECKLRSVLPVNATHRWDATVCDVFKEMTLDRKVGIMMNEDGAELYTEDEKNIGLTLIDMGLAQDPEVAKAQEEAAKETLEVPVETPTEETADTGEAVILYFLAAKGPTEIVCQPASSADSLQELMDNLAAHYEDENNQDRMTPEVGKQCIARFTEDDGWYRAMVEAVDGDDISVRYIDYGNSEAVTQDRLCNIEAQFAELPAQAITYQVIPPLMHQSQWNDDVKALLEESCAERELQVTFVEASGGVQAIKLSKDDLAFILTSLGDTLPPAVEGEGESIVAPELAEEVTLIFLSVEGPAVITCQPASTADALLELMDNIAAYYEDEGNQVAYTPEVGQQCVAKFTEDDGWYRAKVEDVCDTKIAVRYIDYGNSEVVTQDRVCEMQPQFQELAAQAVSYQVQPTLMQQSQWNEDVKAVLEESCAEREIKAHLVKTSDDSLVVQLSKDDIDFFKTSIADVLPPASEEDITQDKDKVDEIVDASVMPVSEEDITQDKDEIDEIVDALVKTAISDALEEMTVPVTIKEAAGVTVMTLFDKVAECLLEEELKEDVATCELDEELDRQEEEDMMEGVKSLVEDIISKAEDIVSKEVGEVTKDEDDQQQVDGEQEECDENEVLSHEILDEIIESVAEGLHISSATETLEGSDGEVEQVDSEVIPDTDTGGITEQDACKQELTATKDKDIEEEDGSQDDKCKETEEHPSPQRKRHKSGEGLPGMESPEEPNDELRDKDSAGESTEEYSPENKKPKITETEASEDVEEEENVEENEEDTEDEEAGEDFEDAEDVMKDNEVNDAVQEDHSSNQEQEDDADVNSEETKEDAKISESEIQSGEGEDTVNPTADQNANSIEVQKENPDEMDQEESFESAPSSPERDSSSETSKETLLTKAGGDVVNGDAIDGEVASAEDGQG